MGASNFRKTETAKTAEIAYSNAIQSALDEHGSDSYNGTISTTKGFVMASDAPRFGTAAFSDWEMKQLDSLQKWGNCMCVEVTGKAAKDVFVRRGIKVRGDKVFYFFGMAAE